MYYYNARWYDATTGRFITEDPARDGQNWFIYTSNNPLKFIDPTGLRPEEGSQAGDGPEPDNEESPADDPTPETPTDDRKSDQGKNQGKDDNGDDNKKKDDPKPDDPEAQVPKPVIPGKDVVPDSAQKVLNDLGVGEDLENINPVSRGETLLGTPYGTGYEGQYNGSMKVPGNPEKVDCSEFVAYANDTSIYRTGEMDNNPDFEQVTEPQPGDTKVWRATDPDTGMTEGHAAILTGEPGRKALLHSDPKGVRYSSDYLDSYYRDNGYNDVTVEYYRRRRN